MKLSVGLLLGLPNSLLIAPEIVEVLELSAALTDHGADAIVDEEGGERGVHEGARRLPAQHHCLFCRRGRAEVPWKWEKVS